MNLLKPILFLLSLPFILVMGQPMREVGRVEIPEGPTGGTQYKDLYLAVDNDIVYLVVENTYQATQLHIYDVADKSSPVPIMEDFLLPSHAILYETLYSRGYLYMGYYYGGVLMVDVSDPFAPDVADIEAQSTNRGACIATDASGYIYSGGDMPSIYDVDEGRLASIRNGALDFVNALERIAVTPDGGYLYGCKIAYPSRDKLGVFDVSDKTTNEPISELNNSFIFPGRCGEMIVSPDGMYLYIMKWKESERGGHGRNEFAIYSLEDPSSPEEIIIMYHPWGFDMALDYTSRILYVRTYSWNTQVFSKICAYDVSGVDQYQPSTPLDPPVKIIGEISIPYPNASRGDLFYADGYLYAVSGRELVVIEALSRSDDCIPVNDRVLLYLPGDGDPHDRSLSGNNGKWCVAGKGRNCTGDIPPYVEGHNGPDSKAFGFDLQPNRLGFVKVDGTNLPLGDERELSSFTMATWFKVDDFGESRYQSILVKGAFRNQWSVGLYVFLKSGRIYMVYGFYNCRQSFAQPKNGPFRYGKWYHVALTYEYPLLKLYVDGDLIGDLVCRLPPPVYANSALGIGGKGAKGNDPLVSGAIDEVTVLDYALSPRKVRQLISYGMCPVVVSCRTVDDHVLLYLPGDGNTNDRSRFCNHGDWCEADKGENCDGDIPPYAEGYSGPDSQAFGYDLSANDLGFVKVDDTDLPLGEGKSNFTMATWFKADNFAARYYQSILVKGSPTSDWSVALFLHSRKKRIAYGFRFCSGFAKPKSGSIEERVWYHLALTFEYPSLKLFIDGNLVGEKVCHQDAELYPDSALGVGGLGAIGSAPLVSGAIDEVVILDQGLSSSEVQQLMIGGMCGIAPGKRGQIVGTVFEDVNGNGLFDPGEPGLSDVAVSIKDSHGEYHCLTSDNEGVYEAFVHVGPAVVNIDESSLPSIPSINKWKQTAGTNPSNVSVPVDGTGTDIDGYQVQW